MYTYVLYLIPFLTIFSTYIVVVVVNVSVFIFERNHQLFQEHKDKIQLKYKFTFLSQIVKRILTI